MPGCQAEWNGRRQRAIHRSVLPRDGMGRGTAHRVVFLGKVDGWVPAEANRAYAIVDSLGTYRATGVLLLVLAQPRWQMVFRPKYAAISTWFDALLHERQLYGWP
jgi:hypothetical protein